MDKFLRLRHQMIPYLHTMNRRASEEGIPLIQPLYYQNPGKWDAFRMKNEYYFGSDILVNPITQPISTATRMGKVMALLPEGTWKMCIRDRHRISIATTEFSVMLH